MRPIFWRAYAPSPAGGWKFLLALGWLLLAAWTTPAVPAEDWAGRWDLTIQDVHRKTLPSWLELRLEPGLWKANFVGRWGNARPLPKVVIQGDHIQFVSPKQEEDSRSDLVFEGKLSGKTLAGSAQGPKKSRASRVELSTAARSFRDQFTCKAITAGSPFGTSC